MILSVPHGQSQYPTAMLNKARYLPVGERLDTEDGRYLDRARDRIRVDHKSAAHGMAENCQLVSTFPQSADAQTVTDFPFN
jgi:hypothetical protein